ncbi:MAG: YraN family protein [Ignavibacteriaceae bacterium]
MEPSTREKGNKCEDIAVDYLIKSGYGIVKRNFRYGKVGELDIVAREGETLVFVEVRSKSKVDSVSPEETVTKDKISRVKRVADFYLYVNGIKNTLCRVDVITIVFVNGDPVLNHYKNVTI